ncbi:MAG: hypothetical protein Fur0040_06880 [Sideroxydans sp.]
MLKPLLHHGRRGARRLLRMALLLGLLLLLAAAGAVLGLRYYLLPQIERYHADIVAASSLALGRPVKIGRIEADWQGLRPRLSLSDVTVLDERGRAAIELPRLFNTVAWGSLLAGELRFDRMELEQPRLRVRRDATGRISIAGIGADSEAGVTSNAATSDWWLRQNHILIHGGQVQWLDELRGAPLLEIGDIELRVQNRGEHHRFAVQARLGTSRPAHIELRGDLYGDSFTDLAAWQGELYAATDQLDVADWQTWLPLPDTVQGGNGRLRLWLKLAHGTVRGADAEFDLHALRAQLAPDLPPLDLHHLRGGLGWTQADDRFALSLRQFSLRTVSGLTLPPTDLFLRYDRARTAHPASGEITLNHLDLALLDPLLAHLPLPDTLRQPLHQMAPQGRVDDLMANWRGELMRPQHFRVQARFADLGVRSYGEWPVVSGLSGEVTGDDHAGTLHLNSHDLHFAAPGFLAEALLFDDLRGRLDWQRSRHGWEFKLNQMQMRNADLEGSVQGYYQMNEGPGVADLTVNLNRASVRHAARYIPQHAFDDATYRWLQTGLQAGEADSFLLRVRGDLRDFPFADNRHGLFRIEAHAPGTAIEFDPGWPRIEQADARLLIEGRLLEVRAAQAMTQGAQLRNVRVAIPDLLAEHLMMEVTGEAPDQTQRCLDYIRHSPVRGYLDGYTDDIRASGDGVLKLQLVIPLDGSAPPQVAGSYRFAANDLDLGEHVPWLRRATGEIAFSNDSVRAEGVQAIVLGGPARINLRSEGDTLKVRADGTLQADSLHDLSPYPLLQRLHGAADWQANISVRRKLADVRVNSTLQGLASDLPYPLHKTPQDSLLLDFEQRDESATRTLTRLRLGDRMQGELVQVRRSGGDWDVERALLHLGDQVLLPPRPGIWIEGRLPQFSLQGWQGWSEFPESGRVLPNIAGISLDIGTMHGFGQVVHDLTIRGSARNGLISTRLTSREISGDVIWQPQDEGRLLVRLKQVALGAADADEVAAAPSATQATTRFSSVLPTFDVSVERLLWHGRLLGKLELLLRGEAGGDAILERFRLSNPDVVFNASGRWQPAQQRTTLDARLELTDSGKALLRFGYPEGLHGGPGTVRVALGWRGAPDEFAYGNLDGKVEVQLGKGRFLQVNPGAARLLGVLSLQALPQRIALDFTDVITPGFEFERIEGEATIQRGQLKTRDFAMTGNAARILLSGEVDLQRETQQLKVRILPTVGDNVSLLSFAAGPAVGVGVLLTNKLLRDPLDKLAAFDYNVSGSWADPKVERVGRSVPVNP